MHDRSAGPDLQHALALTRHHLGRGNERGDALLQHHGAAADDDEFPHRERAAEVDERGRAAAAGFPWVRGPG